jgi:hypothetical protein
METFLLGGNVADPDPIGFDWIRASLGRTWGTLTCSLQGTNIRIYFGLDKHTYTVNSFSNSNS